MKIPVIKLLVDKYSMQELINAETDIINETPLKIEVEGNDEGEQLTHIIAAAWILQDMQVNKVDFKESIRNYTKKVRESIS